MATGSGIPQSNAIVTSDITPTYSVPHDNAIAEALGNAGNAAQDVINGMVTKHYQEQGAKEGAAVAAGTQAYKDVPVITDVGKARQAAFQGAYLAGIKTDIDSHLAQTQRDNALNPAGFKAAAEPIIAGYAKGAPGPFAVQVQQYAQAKAASAFSDLADEKLKHDQITSVNGVNARQQSLTDDMLAMAAAGQDNTPDYAAKKAEWVANNAQKVANPLFNYAPEQAAEAESHQGEQLQGAVLTHHATLAYNDAGGGEAGKAAALQLLKTEALDDGGALKDMPPGVRLKLYGMAAANVRDLDKADAERRAIAAEQDRQAHAEQRDAAGTLALGLTDGSVSEADIRAAEDKGQIEPGAAARLINGARASARRDAAQERTATNLERTAAYGAMAEMAANGQLTPATLAQNGASLTPIQRIALKGRLDKNAKPIIENIVRVASSGFRDAGLQGVSAKLALENLHADAATFAMNNPGATVGQQAAFTADWVKKTKGIVISPTMTPPSAVQTHAQYTAAYKARFHGQGVNDADVENGWKRYQSTHPTAH